MEDIARTAIGAQCSSRKDADKGGDHWWTTRSLMQMESHTLCGEQRRVGRRMGYTGKLDLRVEWRDGERATGSLSKVKR